MALVALMGAGIEPKYILKKVKKMNDPSTRPQTGRRSKAKATLDRNPIEESKQQFKRAMQKSMPGKSQESKSQRTAS